MSYDIPVRRSLLPNNLPVRNFELESMRELIKNIQKDARDISQVFASLPDGKGEQGIKKARRLQEIAQDIENELNDLLIY